MFFNLIPDPETKKERIIRTTDYIDNLLNIRRKTKGYIILLIHFIVIALQALYFIYFKPSYINGVIIAIILLANLTIFLYYGGNGCVLVRLERYFLDDNEWYGPITIIYKLFNIPITETTQYYSELLFNGLWTLAILYLIIKGLRPFRTPSKFF